MQKANPFGLAFCFLCLPIEENLAVCLGYGARYDADEKPGNRLYAAVPAKAANGVEPRGLFAAPGLAGVGAPPHLYSSAVDMCIVCLKPNTYAAVAECAIRA